MRIFPDQNGKRGKFGQHLAARGPNALHFPSARGASPRKHSRWAHCAPRWAPPGAIAFPGPPAGIPLPSRAHHNLRWAPASFHHFLILQQAERPLYGVAPQASFSFAAPLSGYSAMGPLRYRTTPLPSCSAAGSLRRWVSSLRDYSTVRSLRYRAAPLRGSSVATLAVAFAATALGCRLMRRTRWSRCSAG